MPSEYKLKAPVLDYNRLQKICKQIMDDSKEDRNLALEAHRYFRRMVEENPQDASAKNLMVDCLKLAQSSKNNSIKTLTLMIKLEELEATASFEGRSSGVSFTDLESLANEKR